MLPSMAVRCKTYKEKERVECDRPREVAFGGPFILLMTP